jgi:hypothetical protein
MTKQEALENLKQCDHAFLKPEFAVNVCKAFGVKRPYMPTVKANPQDFKGLSLHDDNGDPIDEASGIAAHSLAEHLCKELGVEYTSFHGIGSQLFGCIKALETSLG